MKTHPRVPESVWLSDAARGLRQQMAFWGHDVRHPEGNWLIQFGMDREPSSGLTGTSCYSAPWEDGRVMLHGAVACWFSDGNPGTIYCRERQKIELWKANHPPIPGRERGTHGAAAEVWMSFQPLLRWLVRYEEALRSRHGADWRQCTWRCTKALPKSPAWLPPESALAWWRSAAAGNPVRPKSLR